MNAEATELKGTQEFVGNAVLPVVQQYQPPTLTAYLNAANSGADLERLEKLMDLHERWEDRQALHAFNKAMSDFRSESMVILKTKFVDIAGGAKFWQADGEICDEVIPKMSKHGLYHNWVPRRTESGEEEVSCVIHHSMGCQSEPTTISAPMDKSGNKTEGDARTATRTRLQRYTFLMACGIAPKGMETATTVAGADTVTVEKPKDFDLWAEDAKAAAMKGTEPLMALWKGTPEDLRTYVIAGKKSFWDDCKAVAGKTSKMAKAGAQ